jgi:hypothetical protein
MSQEDPRGQEPRGPTSRLTERGVRLERSSQAVSYDSARQAMTDARRFMRSEIKRVGKRVDDRMESDIHSQVAFLQSRTRSWPRRSG